MIAQFKLLRMRRLKGLGRMVPGLIASLVVVGLMQTNTLNNLERRISTEMLLQRGSRPWDNRIAMISVDDATLKRYGSYQIDRNAYARMLRVLTEEGASVVAFNISFSDESESNRISQNGETVSPSSRSAENANLASAIQNHGRVVLGQPWDENGVEERPVPVLDKPAIAVGHLQLASSDSDGLTRRVQISYKGMPALGVAATQAYTLNRIPLRIPSEQDYLTINWPASGRALATFSLLDVENGNFDRGFFKDKIVVVSYGGQIGPVQIETPFDQRPPLTYVKGQYVESLSAGSPISIEPLPHQRGSVQSGYLHAAVVHNLLQQNWLRQVPEELLIVCILLAGPAFSGAIYRRSTMTRLMLCAGIFVGWIVVCMVALYLNYQLPVLVPLIALTLISAVVSILGRLESNALLQVRSAFLNTMSHEIRTPLNAIVNLSEMLQETPLDERQREFAETLNTSSHTLLALINDVLDFSKIESGRLMIDECPVQLRETVERSLEMLAPRAAEKDLELVYSIAPSTPEVIISDPVRLQQILLNLLSNAVKFTEVGEISVQVQAKVVTQSRSLFPHRSLSAIKPSAIKRKVSGAGDRLFRASRLQTQPVLEPKSLAAPSTPLYEIRFAVHDTGIGIAAEQMGQLFKPFSQVSAATTRKYGGTGLGLSISKRLSERMGGDLWVRSYPGEGSTFYFTVQAPIAAVDPQPLQGLSSDSLTKLSGTRLLLIDRNTTRSHQFTWQLQPLGVRLAQATSLSEALSFMQNDPMFDGIVLDAAIAKTPNECAAAVQTLRRTARNERLPVVLLSPLQTTRSQTTVPILSDTAILWKPIKQAALYQALQSIYSAPLSLSSAPTPRALRTNGLNGAELSVAPSPRSANGQALLKGTVSITDDRRSHVKILVAEDNKTNQKVALRLLELLGYRADVVDTGTAVLNALKRSRYDVVLMDMRMPELDGIETTHRIRQNPQHNGVWIIAMTANAMARDRKMCLAAGMDDYLSKPINRAALDRALLRCPALRPESVKN